MKKIALLSVFTAVLVLTGCASKQPVVAQASGNSAQQSSTGSSSAPQNVSAVNASGVTEGENTSATGAQATADTNEMKMEKLEKSLKTIYFNFDKYNIRPNMQDAMQADAQTIKSSDANYTIKLEGNCDEWGSDEYNFALGLKRAQTVKSQLVQSGIDAKSITMVSYGKTKPVCTQHTRACWQLNRRVNFKILP
jgi:peptidoglycan-associated lipoprotein